MLKTTFSGLQVTTLWLTIRVYLYSFSSCVYQICKIQRNSPKIQFKVINLDANRERICDFLLVINGNFDPFFYYLPRDAL